MSVSNSRGILARFSDPAVGWAVAALIFVVATARAEGPPPDDLTFVPGDSYSYLRIAEAAPGVPAEPVFFHYAQRVTLPYLIGLVHEATGLPLHALFQLSAVLIVVAILVVFARVLERLAVDGAAAALALSTFVLNPWAVRAYLTYPEMVTDLGFVLGLAVLLHGLANERLATLLAGQLIASLGRQTGLLLVPLAVLWVWQVWGRRSRLAACGAVAGIAAGVYAATAALAAGFSYPSENAAHVTELLPWLGTRFDAALLASFLVRLVIAPAIPVLMMLASVHRWRPVPGRRRLVAILCAGSVAIWLQPLLAGPDLTVGNGPRLTALGLLPVCAAAGIVLGDTLAAPAPGSRRFFALLALLALASMHHVYVFSQTPTEMQRALFAATYSIACLGILVVTRAGMRAEPT
ncbi:MAG: hypothetical protein HY824_11565 [Acidobacteria bacterium]|nr:hypothetical protein [Acidobacteriota bacterium]